MIEFWPEYGIIIDTIAALVLQYNSNKEGQVRQRMGLGEKGIQWIRENIPVPGKEMGIFFECHNNQRDPFLSYMFFTSGDELLPCSFQEYREKTFTSKRIKEALLEYYISMEVQKNSIEEIHGQIMQSEYSAEIRSSLNGFLLDSNYYIKMLMNLLDVTYKKVKNYHQKCSNLINEVAGAVDEEGLKSVDKAMQIHENYTDMNMLISISLVAEYRLGRRGVGTAIDDIIIYLFGTQWHEKLQQYIEDSHTDINTFGKITSEINRVKIVDYLLQHKEITMAEAVEYLGTSVTATNYHINMMADAKMLSVRNEGRKLFFSLDRKYFDGMISSLRNIADQIED